MNGYTAALFGSIVPIFVLVMMGYSLRRLGAIGAPGTERLSRVVLLFLFPVLVFHRLATTENPSSMIADGQIVLWAVVVLVGSGLIGWGWYRMLRLKADFRLFVFLVGMPNWIYLPLAVAGPIWGEEAVRLIILFNIPTQFLLWTAGIWLLKGELRGTHALRYIVTSPGLIATIAGLLVAFGVIPLSLAPDQPGLSIAALVPLLHVLGGLTIPLSLVALGLYVGEKVTDGTGLIGDVGWVCLGRLVVAPLLIIGLIMAVAVAGFASNTMMRWVVYLIVVMPVAVSCPLFADMFDRDRALASRGVMVSTMIGFITAPLWVLLALKVELWLGLGGVTN